MGKIPIRKYLHNSNPQDVSEYLQMVEKENIREKLFKNEKVKALKARKAARRPSNNGGSSNGTNS